MAALGLLLLFLQIGQFLAEPTLKNLVTEPTTLQQLGTYLVRGQLLSPDLAVDGIWSVHPFLCATTSFPKNDTLRPYWSITFHEAHEIKEIVLMFRYDRLDKHRVYTVKIDGKVCHSRKDKNKDPERIERIKCGTKLSGKKVEISIPSKKEAGSQSLPQLSICEVAIFAPACSPGTYGPKCDQKCGFCEGGYKDCNSSTGVCSLGCEAGYTGSHCTGINFAEGQATYKLGTSEETEGTEVDGDTSTKQKEFCLKLERQTKGSRELGWRLQLTKTVQVSEIIIFSPKEAALRNGLKNIQITVGGQQCATRRNAVAPENMGIPCTTPRSGKEVVIKNTDKGVKEMYLCEVQVIVCPVGMYGEECRKACNKCKEGTQCNPYNGNCQPCPGKKCPEPDSDFLMPEPVKIVGTQVPELPKTSCSNKKWGVNCTLPCNCKNANEQCYKPDGSCKSSCREGYEGINCLKECDFLFFGKNCEFVCHCKDTKEQCDKVTGACKSGCRKPWSGQSCQTGPKDQLDRGAFDCGGDYTWGPTCKEKCNCRLQSEKCNVFNGACPHTGCASGFTGTSCIEPCPNGTFGLDCQKKCRCRDPKEVCVKETGKCAISGCARGFTGLDCYKPCKAFTHGYNCDTPCRCANKDEICDSISGECKSGCQPGWDFVTDKSCNTTCPQGKYGANCLVQCGNCKDDTCNHVSGQCPGECEAGFRGSKCIEECEKGKYGPGCSRKCNCMDPNEVCDHRTGSCPKSGCPAGKQGVDCQEDCTKGTYGPNCKQACQKCLGGHINCDIKNGKCAVDCVPGFKGDKCDQQCPKGRFGENCTSKCGECFQKCQEDGTCEKELCKPGFLDKQCTKPCGVDKWGDHCDGRCGKCKLPPNGACNISTGECIGGCQKGYTGTFCTTLCNKTGQCEVECGKCKGGKQNCDTKKGVCMTGCEEGVYGLACDKKCVAGKWGPSCDRMCGHCLKGPKSCDPETGMCPDNECEPAYEGELCNDLVHPSCRGKTVCIKCGKCHGGKDECDFQTGLCKDKCEPGYKGLNCSQRCDRLTYGQNCQRICRCPGECACDHVTGKCTEFCIVYVGDHNMTAMSPGWLFPVVLAVVICCCTMCIYVFVAWRRRKKEKKLLVVLHQDSPSDKKKTKPDLAQ